MAHSGILSIDWFKGKITGKSHISWKNLWFRVDFSLSQPNDSYHPRSLSPPTRLTQLPPGLDNDWSETFSHLSQQLQQVLVATGVPGPRSDENFTENW